MAEEEKVKKTEYIDYYKLKDTAIEYIKKIGGKKWNDYNEHDPGITILENLCFAIMDLDYRLKFPIVDLLARDPKKKGKLKSFFKPEEILPTSPVTLNDYYKLILDVDCVRNCKIFANDSGNRIKGCYDVLLWVEPAYEKNQKKVIEDVRKILNANRNLCEDFNEIKIFKVIDVYIDITLEPNLNILRTPGAYDSYVAQTLCDIQEYFIPKILFKSLSEAFKIKKNLDEVYEGPLLNHGFILDEDLEKNKIKNKFILIDIIDKISSNDQVWKLINFSVYNTETNAEYKNFIETSPDEIVRVNFSKSKIKLVHNNDVISTNPFNVLMLAKRFYANLNFHNEVPEEEMFFPEGEYKKLGNYYSIQNDFPLIYNVGKEGYSQDETPDKKEQIKNLKKYLLIFDQLLCNQQKRLDNIKNLFAIESEGENFVKYQLPTTIPNLKSLLKYPHKSKSNIDDNEFDIQKRYLNTDISYANSGFYETCNDYVNSLVKDSEKNLKDDILDHLLARFDEKVEIQDYERRNITEIKQKFLKNYADLSFYRAKAIDISSDSTKIHFSMSTFEKKLCILFDINKLENKMLHKYVKDKFFVWRGFEQQNVQVLLRKENQNSTDFVFKSKYSDIFKYVLAYGNNEKNYSITKIQNKINPVQGESDNFFYDIKLYIDDTKTKFINLESTKSKITDYNLAKKIISKALTKISQFNEENEGFHLVEHILLRSKDEINDDVDNYSFKISIVFPDWPYRFQKENFRKMITKWINANLPAHIQANILWLDVKQMEIFEYAYQYWLDAKTSRDIDKEKLDKASDNLLKIILKWS